MNNTDNLNIPLIDRSKPLLSDQFNNALKQIDKNALNKIHESSKAHWLMWQPNTAYVKQDVLRTTTIPSWGFWEVIVPGTSGITEPVGYGEGDTYTDGTVSLVLRRLTIAGSGSSGTSTDPSTAEPWATGTVYAKNKLVSHNESLYMCLIDHTAGVFDADLSKGCWKQIDSDQTVVGSASGYSQVTKLNVAAPKTVKISINRTKTFCLPPVEVLKFKAGDANIVVTECGFDNTDKTDFTHSNQVDFDGSMHLVTKFNVSMSTPVEVTTETGYISESDEIDFSSYKNVEGVDIE